MRELRTDLQSNMKMCPACSILLYSTQALIQTCKIIYYTSSLNEEVVRRVPIFLYNYFHFDCMKLSDRWASREPSRKLWP